jgi:DNA-binding XRE family transcriptional regulator
MNNLPRACELAWSRLDGSGERTPPYIVERITTPLEVSTLRKICLLTQRELADLLGTTEASVNRLENERTPLDTRWASHLTLLFAHLTKKKVEG